MDQIIIEIHGGVANVIKKSVGVELIIRDFDVIHDDETPDLDEDGNPFIEEIYASEDPVPYIFPEADDKV